MKYIHWCEKVDLLRADLNLQQSTIPSVYLDHLNQYASFS